MSKNDETEQNLGGNRSYIGGGLHVDAEDLCTFSQILLSAGKLSNLLFSNLQSTIALVLKRVLPLD